jgi:hypothetical protein
MFSTGPSPVPVTISIGYFYIDTILILSSHLVVGLKNSSYLNSFVYKILCNFFIIEQVSILVFVSFSRQTRASNLPEDTVIPTPGSGASDPEDLRRRLCHLQTVHRHLLTVPYTRVIDD